MSLLAAAFYFLITYVGSSLIVLAALEKLLRADEDGAAFSPLERILYALGIGPALIPLALYFLYLFVPRSGDWSYVLSVVALFSLIAYWARDHFRTAGESLRGEFHRLKQELRPCRRETVAVLAIIAPVCVYILFQGMAFPIASHDGTVYGCLGRSLYQMGSLDNYPMVTSDPTTGLFMPLSHPPSLPLFYTWFHLLSGTVTSDLLQRTVSPVYAMYLLALLATVLSRRAKGLSAACGVLFMVFTPIFVWQSYENSVDPFRMFFIFMSFLCLANSLATKGRGPTVILGLACGLSMFAHVTGVLTSGVAMAVYFLLNRLRPWDRFRRWLAVAAIALCLSGTHYYRNYAKFGNVLGPASWSLFNFSAKNFYSNLELSYRGQDGHYGLKSMGALSLAIRGAPREEGTSQDRAAILLQAFRGRLADLIEFVGAIQVPKSLVWGRLQIFSRPELFGITYFAFLLSGIYWSCRMEKEDRDVVLMLGALLIAAPILYKFYSNRRYIFTIQPLAVYFCGLGAGRLCGWILRKKGVKLLGGAAILVLLAAIGPLFLPGSMGKLKLSAGDAGALLQYLVSPRTDQNRMLCPGLFEAIEHINSATPHDSLVLTSSDARYFYFATRKGVFWRDPRMATFYGLRTKEEAHEFLVRLGVDYILIDFPTGATHYHFTESLLQDLVDDETMCQLLFDEKTRLFRLKKRPSITSS